MNEDRFEGAASNLGGKVKDAFGGLTGDTKLQAQGKAAQVGGQVQNTYGAVKDEAREVAQTLGSQIDTMMKQQPVVVLLAAIGLGYVLRMLTSDRG